MIPKYKTPLTIPPVMPRTGKVVVKGGKNIDYYEIAVRQFEQQILPVVMGLTTTVWSYGSVNHPWTFNYPAYTIEAKHGEPVRVKWINELVDSDGNYLPHLLPVDQTLHWANPLGDCIDGPSRPDCRGESQMPYVGPVPIVTHVHGAHTFQDSDGYPEAWYLPNAQNLPPEILFGEGTLYDTFEAQAAALGRDWGPGFAVFQYSNDQPATTLWYHDHSLGMTRVNVYAGPAGFYLIRGGPGDIGKKKTLPGPAPRRNDLPGTPIYEIPIAIQDRSFYPDGSLFYPDNRAFFEGLEIDQLDIPFIPEVTVSGETSDVSPIWIPEFFGNTIVVNGKTWPYLEVEPRRYRFRLLNGSNARFLLLENDEDLPFYQIGADGGFLPEPVELRRLVMAPGERADVVVDFSELPVGTTVRLLNLGPDTPFGGGEPGVDFQPADLTTTGQIMEFRVVAPVPGKPDLSDDPAVGELELPQLSPLPPPDEPDMPRTLSLNEEDSHTVFVDEQGGGIVEVPEGDGVAFDPVAALLGTVVSGDPMSMLWDDPITENPDVGATEVWELYNFTADAHPIHLHMVQFEVLGRQALATDSEGVATKPAQVVGSPMDPEWWEEGLKDTVIAYPGEVTRIKAHFDLAGLFVWHCHILEHEDNEMMRPYHVGPIPADLPVGP